MIERINKIIVDVFEIKENEIKPELSKDDIASWDSLKHMDLVVSIESEFGIELEIEDIIRMNTIGDITEVITSKSVG